MLYFRNIRQFIKVARCKKRRIRVDGTARGNTQENMNTYYILHRKQVVFTTIYKFN